MPLLPLRPIHQMGLRASTKDAGPVSEPPSITDAHGFTPGEKEAFRLLLRGCTDAAIAEELQISEAGVRSILRRIMRKLSVSGRDQIIRRANDWDLAVSRLLR